MDGWASHRKAVSSDPPVFPSSSFHRVCASVFDASFARPRELLSDVAGLFLIEVRLPFAANNALDTVDGIALYLIINGHLLS